MPRTLTTHLRPGFGRRLKKSREAAKVSQRQLAFPGCTAAYISRLEADARNPSLQLINELASRLTVDPGWLATGVRQKTPEAAAAAAVTVVSSQGSPLAAYSERGDAERFAAVYSSLHGLEPEGLIREVWLDRDPDEHAKDLLFSA